MAKRRQTVDQWITSVIAEVIDNKPCSAIALLHLKGVGGATEEVTTKPLEGTVNVKDLADHFIGRAEGFAQELPGLQTFKLIAFYGTNEPHNPFHFTTSDGNLISRSEAMQSAHEPTPPGLLGQLMKHNEEIMRRNGELVHAQAQMAQGIMGMFLGPQGVLAASRQTEIEAIGVVRDAMLDMFKQKKEIRLEELKAAQDLQTRKAVIDAVPHLVNRWTGREVFSEESNKAAIVDKLAFRITPQDLDMLVQMGKLSKEEAMILGAQLAAVVEAKKKELEALKQVPTEEGESKAITSTNGQANGKGDDL